MDQGFGRNAHPISESLIGENEAALTVHRVEADLRILQEIGQFAVLLGDHLLHLMACGDILEAPQGTTGLTGKRPRLNPQPFGTSVAGGGAELAVAGTAGPRGLHHRREAIGTVLAVDAAGQTGENLAAGIGHDLGKGLVAPTQAAIGP